MSKLWTVTKEIQVVVVADSLRDAEWVAQDHECEIDDDGDGWMASEFYLPPGWNRNCIPYGADDDDTIGDLLDRQAEAEKEAKLIAEFNAKQVTLDEVLASRVSGPLAQSGDSDG